MHMRSQIFALALMCYSTAPIAQTFFAWGTKTCGEAIQAIERGGQIWETHYVQFVLGYLSGYNDAALTLTRNDALTGQGISADTIAAMFKNKCRQDALKLVIQAASEIRVELEKNKP